MDVILDRGSTPLTSRNNEKPDAVASGFSIPILDQIRLLPGKRRPSDA